MRLISRRSRKQLHEMLILKCTDGDQDSDIQNTLNEIQELAKNSSCHYEDMEYADQRTDLMRLPIPLLPQSARDLDNLFHEKMGAFVFKWAEGRGFRIESRRHQGPQIVWLQAGGLSIELDRISIFTIVPRPKPRDTGRTETTTDENIVEEELPPCKGVVVSFITGPITIKRLFECYTGDVIILEGGETLLVSPPKEGDTGPRDVCMLTTLHRTGPKGGDIVGTRA